MFIYFLFIVGFIFLIKGADMLVTGASTIAKRFNISPIIIGLTIVAFGTSLPELIVNIFAVTHGTTDIAIGNILGSSISNIFLILGISAIIYPLAAQKNTVWKEIPLGLLAAISLGVMANDKIIDGLELSILSRIDGIILLFFFGIFIYYTFVTAKIEETVSQTPISNSLYWKAIIYIIIGLIGLTVGGKWIVDGAIHIAEYFKMSHSLIGLTIVAVGTSLPELATSALAAYKKETEIAIGNIVGSNIFNIFFVLGISAIIKPLPFNQNSQTDIFITIFATIVLFLTMFLGKKYIIERGQGLVMLLLYIAYIIFTITVHGV